MSSINSPEQYGYESPEEQLGYYKGAIAGQAAANLLISQMYSEAYIQARTNKVTGLPNGVALTERLTQLEAEGRLDDYAFLWADGDNFKAVNDLVSHARGDEILRETGTALLKSLRISDKDELFNPSGDEFVGLIYIKPSGNKRRRNIEATQQDVDLVRDRIKNEMQNVLVRNQDVQDLGYGVSTGVAKPEPGKTLEALKLEAERSMHEEKGEHHETHGQYRRPDA